MKPSALLSSDLHWRESQPACRTDKFPDAFVPKARLAKSICEKYNIPFIVAGDISEKWKNWQSLIDVMLREMPNFICIPGQHDLPGHNLQLIKGSTLSALEAGGRATIIKEPGGLVKCNDFVVYGYPYGTEPKPRRKRRGDDTRSMCMLHALVTDTKDPFPGANAYTAKGLLNELTGYDLILSGDNHQQFTVTKRGRHLINPGSMIRQDADQINHQPRFYLWFAEDNHFEPIDIPVDKKVVVRSHIEKKNERDDRIDKYIDSMDADYEVKLDYKLNLDVHMKTNKVNDDTKGLILEWLED